MPARRDAGALAPPGHYAATVADDDEDGSAPPHRDEELSGPARGRPRVPCVGAVVQAEDGRLLLVRRGRPPARGRWSLPGGHVEPGESEEQAVVREVAEETGLVVTVGTLVGRVEREGPGGSVYDIADYACSVGGGTLRPGDDAADVQWVDAASLRRLPTSDGLVEALTAWSVLPRCR